MAFIRKKQTNGTYYYSLVERIKTDKGFRIKTLESYGTQKPFLYEPLLINSDCLEATKKFQDRYFDLILTDPPYFIDVSRPKYGLSYKDSETDIGDWDTFGNVEEYYKFCDKWLDECSRVLKKGGIIVSFFDKSKISYFIDYLTDNHKFKLIDVFVWVKTNPVPAVNKNSFQQGTEFIIVMKKEGKPHTFNYERGQQPNYILLPICGGHERNKHGHHNTQKPIKLLELFILYFSNESDKVLDLFMGKGSTPLACTINKRQSVGIERNPHHFYNSENRIAEYLNKQGEHIEKIPTDANV